MDPTLPPHVPPESMSVSPLRCLQVSKINHLQSEHRSVKYWRPWCPKQKREQAIVFTRTAPPPADPHLRSLPASSSCGKPEPIGVLYSPQDQWHSFPSAVTRRREAEFLPPRRRVAVQSRKVKNHITKNTVVEDK